MSRVAVVAVGLLAIAGCDSTSPGGPASTTSPSAASWEMPDLVGATLQDAQNQIQRLTGGEVFHTDSHDLSGEDRNQVVDANWKVCTQNVAPGGELTPTSEVDFGVVQLDESCP